VLDAQGGSWDVRGVYQRELAAPLFSGQPSAETETALADALTAVGEEFRRDYAAVHVALPDTVIRGAVFELDELPRTSALREALLRWRFAEVWKRPEDSLECRGVDLGEDRGKRLLFGQAGDGSWVTCVRGALERVGITPWSLNAAAAYRFNRFHDVITVGSGALLALDPDCWNLQLWDGHGRARQMLTRLRHVERSTDETGMIADEVGRAVLAHVEKSGAAVDKLFLAGCGNELAALSKVLDERLHRNALPLHADEGLTGTLAAMREGLAPLAVAAALSL
jgi:hypothetical protein